MVIFLFLIFALFLNEDKNMEENLGLDNILGAEEIENLFVDTSPIEEPSAPKENPESKDDKTTDTTTEVDVNNLFANPESVSSDDKSKEDTTPSSDSSSPNFYSSIAKALKEEGIFPNLTDEDFKDVNKADAFKALIEKQVKSSLDERQKRVDAALNAQLPTDTIKMYENTLGTLQGISEELLTKEDEQGENIRKNLIYQDFINRGYSQERALKEIEKSFNAGTDIDDARDALQGNIEYYQKEYNNLINQGKQQAKKVQDEIQTQAASLKDSILKDEGLFKELNVDTATRQRINDNISKATVKDASTGQYLTAIQQYQKEHPVEFLKNLSLFFTLTDGFTKLDSLVKNKVKTEVNKGLKSLEHTLNNTSRNASGGLNFVSGVSDDPESFLGKGWKLDI